MSSFDLVCHQRLTAKLAERVSDRRLLVLIGRMLKAKVLLPDGDTAIEVRSTDGLARWERVGMLTMALDVARASAVQDYEPRDEEDDDG